MAQPNRKQSKKQKEQAARKAQQQKKLLVGVGIIGALILLVVFIRHWQSAETDRLAEAAYSKGAENAPIVMKEFSDYQ